MAFIDARSPLRLSEICMALLAIAEKPLEYASPRFGNEELGPDQGCAAKLGRQASASVVLNCAAQIWSETVFCLMVLEPQFPLAEDVADFVKESRLPWLSYVETVYKLCQRTFRGTASQHKAQIIFQLRDALMHDKPEPAGRMAEDYSEAIELWRRRLQPLVGREAIDWLPDMGHAHKDATFMLFGEPVIMKFMKYPIVKWVFDSTNGLCKEMQDMVLHNPGPKRLREQLISDGRGDGIPSGLWFAGRYTTTEEPA